MPDTCPLCGATMQVIARLGCYGCVCGYWEELIVANNGTIVATPHAPNRQAVVDSSREEET